ncbi:oxysterol-binding protein 1 isoform X2 [Teleopsis dalmanni]|uniref:oxysterol-binding protein 1 isoform X2 n=1 Tax=Teleopsis dalmanni TaxID=139649 RepID=UPI0018CD4F4F|nr:oxysterol-binding protein 1 isoform X2 [Teleopsis dalmanni]
MSENNAKATPEKKDPEMKGWLLKWTNYIKGYQRRWFVLSNGVLSYYRNQAEINHTCRGTISLHGALIHTVDSCTFAISNGGTQTFHIKAGNEVERQSWVTALELAKAKAIRAMESEEEEEEETAQVVPSEELNTVRALSELETNDQEQLSSRTKIVNERATLFRITSNAMINACNDYLSTAETQGHKWSKMLLHEREQRQRLEDMVEQLAKQHTQLEHAAQLNVQQNKIMPRHGNSIMTVTSDDENEFFDAEENMCFGDELLQETVEEEPSTSNRDTVDRSSVNIPEPITLTPTNSIVLRKRRTRIPDKPNYPLNLWSFMKNCIGKELSKIPMPVNFNEPLSMLQRLGEDYEYAYLLDKAAQTNDKCEQLSYIAAFAITSYSTTRTSKPFNPLLGETYECDRTDDLGWRMIAEQVSHHPPMAAVHCEGRGWKCWQEFTMTSKFRGKYLQVIPLGNAYVEFTASGNKYTWHKVTTTVNNIIVGKLWVDHHGEMEMKGLKSAAGINARIKYIPYSYFSREQQRRVKGEVFDENKSVKWLLRGTWDTKIEIAKVVSANGTTENPLYKTSPFTTVWNRRLPEPDSDKYYGFTVLACQLNEHEENVAPTDSRLRPDQRLMEEGKWDESNVQKIRLEEKQRAKRRERESEAESAASAGRPYPPYESIWFTRQKEEGVESVVHIYNGRYWEHKRDQDWSICPDLY